MRSKIFLSVLVVISLAFSIVSAVEADSPSPIPSGGNNTLGPYTPTQEELAKLAAKNSAALAHYNQKSIVSALAKGNLNVGNGEQYREPNDYAHRNYCGPSATQVAIRARTTTVPGLETVAKGEYLTQGSGVWIANITPYINKYLKTTWYLTGYASNQTELRVWINLDIDSKYALITGVWTAGMPGWSVSADHIITVFAYDFTTPTKYISYVDTASEYAGHHYKSGGAYFNWWIKLDTFWNWVNNNDAQTW
jgi:hypothetical protein